VAEPDGRDWIAATIVGGKTISYPWESPSMASINGVPTSHGADYHKG